MHDLKRQKEDDFRDISMLEEAGGCLLCSSAPCTKACPYGLPVDSVIRSIRFENGSGAEKLLSRALQEKNKFLQLPCLHCSEKACLNACPKGRINRPVPIDELLARLPLHAADEAKHMPEIDLSIDFCGIQCENPFFLSSSVVCSNYEMVARAFDMGWAGAAFKTIGTFVPNEVSPRFDALRKEAVPFVGFKNIEQISEYSLEENLGFLRRLKRDYPTKVIIASIMGRNEEEWTKLAALMTEAGADILECNFSCPHMAADGLGSDVGQNPELVAAFTRAVRKGSSLPILAKMTPNLGNMEPPALAAIRAGATGIAAINTIKSIMNVNLDTFASGPDVQGKTSVGGYSGKAVKPIALRFLHGLRSCTELSDVPLSGMGGIETWRDAAEFLAMGCENVQITTAVMQYGYRIIDDLQEGLRLHLASHGLANIRELVGKAVPHILPSEVLDRSSICYPKFDRHKCVGCGRCAVSCQDGGHQALRQDLHTGGPVMDVGKCVGCHLCVVVCPALAIGPGARRVKQPTRIKRSMEAS